MDNTITTSDKKGGRYTKKQQEERKLQVFHLHFEEEKSAVEIATLLKVNRNTINDDITYWYQRIGNKKNVQDIIIKLERQILLLYIQRDRLLEYLEDAENISDKLKIERFLFDIDNKLTIIFSKMLDGREDFPLRIEIPDAIEDSYDDISAKDVKEFVKYLISSRLNHNLIYSEDELRFNFMQNKKCSYEFAARVIEKMKRSGLNLCIEPTYDPSILQITSPGDTSARYLIEKFAKLKDYA